MAKDDKFQDLIDLKNTLWGQQYKDPLDRIPTYNNYLNAGSGTDLRQSLMSKADQFIKRYKTPPAELMFDKSQRFLPPGQYPGADELIGKFGPDTHMDPWGWTHSKLPHQYETPTQREMSMRHYDELKNTPEAIERAKIMYDVQRKLASKYYPELIEKPRSQTAFGGVGGKSANSWGEEDVTPNQSWGEEQVPAMQALSQYNK